MLFRFDVRQALDAGQGATLRATLGHALYKNGKFALAGALRTRWLSGTAMRTTFGIAPEQAASSGAGLPAFEARSGFSEVSLSFLARYDVGDDYHLLALAGYGWLLGDAADSPLVANGAGSPDQLRIGVGFTIDF